MTVPLLPLLLPLLIALLLWRLVRATKKAGPGSTPDVPPFYLAMVALLKKRGLCRKLSETPLEFAERSGHSVVLEITDLYLKIRYGHGMMTPQLMKEVEEKLRLIGDGQRK